MEKAQGGQAPPTETPPTIPAIPATFGGGGLAQPGDTMGGT